MAEDFEPRRADEPGQRYDWADEFGNAVVLKADEDGVVHPKNDAQRRAADAFGLPVARKALAEERAQEREQEPTRTPARRREG